MKRLSKPILALLLAGSLLFSTTVVSFGYEGGDPVDKCISVYRFKDMR